MEKWEGPLEFPWRKITEIQNVNENYWKFFKKNFFRKKVQKTNSFQKSSQPTLKRTSTSPESQKKFKHQWRRRFSFLPLAWETEFSTQTRCRKDTGSSLKLWGQPRDSQMLLCSLLQAWKSPRQSFSFFPFSKTLHAENVIFRTSAFSPVERDFLLLCARCGPQKKREKLQ